MEAIHVQTQEEYDALMIHLEKKGYRWENNIMPTSVKYIHRTYKETTCIVLGKRLEYCYKEYYVKNGYKILTFKEYMERENKDTFTRGDVVMVRDNDEEWNTRIYLTTIKGTYSPYICVQPHDNEKFKKGEQFNISCLKQIKKKEETVTITLSKSDHEKVKQLLNI